MSPSLKIEKNNRERDRDIFHLLLYSASGHSTRDVSGRTQETGAIQVFHTGAGVKAFGLSSDAFPGKLTRSWIGRK